MANCLAIHLAEQVQYDHQKGKSICISLKQCILPNEDILQAIVKCLKEYSSDRQFFKLDLSNQVSDQVNINGDEIETLLEQACYRFNKMISIELNLDAWGNLYRVFSYIKDPIVTCKNTLKQLIIKGNNKSLNPSISNKALKNISVILANLDQLTYLSLELGDQSSEKVKQIQEDGFQAFAKGLSHLTKLKYLNLNLTAWHSSFRSQVKEPRPLFKMLIDSIINNKQLEVLHLNFSWWEQMNFYCVGDLAEGLSTLSNTLKNLSLNFHRFSYYNNTYDIQAIQQLGAAFSKLNVSQLHLDLFEIGGYKSQSTYSYNGQQDIRLEKMICSLQTMKNLIFLDLKIREYIDSKGMMLMKKYLGNMKNLVHLKLDINVPYDEKRRYLSNLIQLYQQKRQNVYSSLAVKSKISRRFRREVLYEIISILL